MAYVVVALESYGPYLVAALESYGPYLVMALESYGLTAANDNAGTRPGRRHQNATARPPGLCPAASCCGPGFAHSPSRARQKKRFGARLREHPSRGRPPLLTPFSFEKKARRGGRLCRRLAKLGPMMLFFSLAIEGRSIGAGWPGK